MHFHLVLILCNIAKKSEKKSVNQKQKKSVNQVLQLFQLRTAADGSRIKRKSRIRFVDMAGSERASKSGTTGDHLREGISINMSISGLHSVIKWAFVVLAWKDYGGKERKLLFCGTQVQNKNL